MFEAIIVNLIISALIYVISPRPSKPPGPTAGKLDIPAPRLGTPIRVVFGEDWIEDAAISYYGNPNTQPIKS